MLIIVILLFLLLLIVIYFLRNPTLLLIPYNEFIENIYEKKVFYTEEEKKKIFPTSTFLENRWLDIRRECLSALDNFNNLGNVGNVGQNFIVEDEDFWKGWKTFPLRMFGVDNEENMRKCPLLAEILKSDKNIPTAFFSIMEPGKTLTSHYGPFKGILRYHLGLIVPPEESGPCFISVDNEIYDWKEGEGILFDETYKHFVHNKTPYHRVVLFIDVKRPFNSSLLTLLNDFILFLMGISPYNLLH